MSIKISNLVVNVWLSQLSALIGLSPLLNIYSGPVPTTVDDYEAGTLLCSIALSANWMGPVTDRSASLRALPVRGVGVATGAVSHFRLVSSDGFMPFLQGLAGASEDTNDLVLDSDIVVVAQPVTIESFVFRFP